MVIVTCQHTGIEFEAATRRSKNHPLVSDFLNEANADRHTSGAYRKAQELLKAAKGSTADIDSLMSAVQADYEAWKSGAAEQAQSANARRRQEKRQSDDAKSKRQQQNAFLRGHGYTWHKEDEESMDSFGATAFQARFGSFISEAWVLTAPDGREVTVIQALAEIKASK